MCALMNGRFQTAAGYSPPIISRSERVLAKGFSPRMNRRLIEVGRWQQRRRVGLGDNCGAIGDDAVAIESPVMTRLRCCPSVCALSSGASGRHRTTDAATHPFCA